MGKHLWSPFKSKNGNEESSGAEQASPRSIINAVYYPNWRVYRKQPPSSMNLEFITHIYYAFARVRKEGAIYLTDEYADKEIDINGRKGCIDDLRDVKQRHPHIKTVLSLGGGGEGSEPFADMASTNKTRFAFAASARAVVDTHGFDGIDIDWEHPSNASQGHHYVQMLTDLRKDLPAPQYLLTSALPAGQWALKEIDLSKAAAYLDLVNLMTYDFAGPWTNVCGHHAQLYTPRQPHNDAARTSGDSAVTYLVSKGVPASKIVLGIPAYGRSFLGSTGVGSSYHSSGGEEGTFEYRDLPSPGSVPQFDQSIGAVYCISDSGGFVTYDDPRSVQMKANYVRNKHLAGLFYWTGTGDSNDSRSLVEAGYRTLCS